MLRRKVYDQLMEWKGRKHKCLLIKGQRQTGKTFIVEEFGKRNYKNVVEINLHENLDIRKAFDSNLDVDTIVANLSLMLDRSDIQPGTTLLFFDEIQDCPRARSSLKSFTIDGRYDVIASGSLLGIEDSKLYKRRHRVEGELPPLIPVGYEEQITMYGLDFEEFLWALGMDEQMTGNIRKRIADREPFGEAALEALLSRFREFTIVGGMPECVNKYLVRRNPMDTVDAMKEIVDTVVNDINRYNDERESTKTLACFRSIRNQLADTNKRFMLSRIDDVQGSRAAMEKYRENLLWIKYSGVGNFCYSVSQPSKPLVANMNEDVFRIYLSDTGMLTYQYGNPARLAVVRRDGSYNQGAVMENEIAECLTKSGMGPYYYRKTNGKGQMELDFVIELGCDLTVIEVKSGKSRNTASLSKVADHFRIDRRIILEEGDICRDENGIEHFPLFFAAFADDLIDAEYRGLMSGEEPWFPRDDDSALDILRD